MAAAVFIPPSPHDLLSSMSTTRSRAPLANIPNATNSPHRLLVPSISKRQRTQAASNEENEPLQKRQMLEKDITNPGQTTPHRRLAVPAGEGRVFDRGSATSQPTAFQRKLVAARDEGTTFKVTKSHERSTNDTTENIRLWQKHYRKAFPGFSFYFESIPEDMRARFSRQVANLGAREEKFFSKTVTHIITTRPIPPEVGSPGSDSTSSAHLDSGAGENQPRTINPTLLEKNFVSTRTYLIGGPRQDADQDRNRPNTGVSIRRDRSGNMDVLTRGRQMGMKIWASEKLQRILASMLDESGAHGHNTRSNNAAVTAARGKEEDLSQVLRNERLNGPSDRDTSTLSKEMITFKGPFIYIHDMDEKTRPTMVREYPKVAKRSDGAWPQFRSATVGKCPFLEDPSTRREVERERGRDKETALQHTKESQQPSRNRSVAHTEDVHMNPPRRTSPRKALQEVRNVSAMPDAAKSILETQKCVAAPSMERKSSFPPAFDSVNFVRPTVMHFGGEPAASGIQQSNLTSAIRSNMISSTAAAPGAKAGTSKEVHELKRKVLERANTASLSVGSMPSSHRMTDIAGALKNARAPAPQRAAKSKAQEKLGGIQEEANHSDDDLAAERAANAPPRRKKATKRDPKPGYCENCRDKYDDFEEHIVSRKHRKFALTQANWTELDQLLQLLQVPAS